MTLPVIDLDDTPENSDWIKFRWNLPPYLSEEFMKWLKDNGLTLEQFKRLPKYNFAVSQGLIKNDKWTGKAQKQE